MQHNGSSRAQKRHDICLEFGCTSAKHKENFSAFMKREVMICAGGFIRLQNTKSILLPEADSTNFIVVAFLDDEVIAAVALSERFGHGEF